MFELGSEVVVNGTWDDMEFKDTVAYIYRLPSDDEGAFYGNSYLLLYMPSWAGMGAGHGEASYEENRLDFLPEPDKDHGSWNVPADWLENGNIRLVRNSMLYELGPYWKVIRKIQQMKDRRKALGYAF